MMAGTPAQRVLHLAWTEFQRRQVAMASLLGSECVFLGRRHTQALLLKALDYLRLFCKTVILLRRRRPAVLWLQMPPLPLLWAAMLHRWLVDSRVRLVADAHNATFGDMWSRVPGGVACLNRCDLVIVHNEMVHADALAQGVERQRLFVLEDVPAGNVPAQDASEVSKPAWRWLADLPRPWILFPGSFSADEPVAELLTVARAHPQWTFIITGRLTNAKRYHHDLTAVPPNVAMPGYLAVEEFNQLLRACDLVLALTRNDGIQLSACNEAIGFGKAMVASDTPLLRKLFSGAALMVNSDHPQTLSDGIDNALKQVAELQAASERLAVQRRLEWEQRMASGPCWLGGSSSD